MGDWSLGSVTSFVFDMLDDIPTSFSGTRMLEVADQRRAFVENFTGQTIGSTSISLQFQGIIANLTTAKIATFMNAQGADASSVRLGEFTIKKGGDSNLVKVASACQALAMGELKEIGRRVRFKKTNG